MNAAIPGDPTAQAHLRPVLVCESLSERVSAVVVSGMGWELGVATFFSGVVSCSLHSLDPRYAGGAHPFLILVASPAFQWRVLTRRYETARPRGNIHAHLARAALYLLQDVLQVKRLVRATRADSQSGVAMPTWHVESMIVGYARSPQLLSWNTQLPQSVGEQHKACLQLLARSPPPRRTGQ